MMKQVTGSARRDGLARTLLRSTAIIVGCAMLGACPGPKGSPEPVSARFSTPVLYVEPGETAIVIVSQNGFSPTLAPAAAIEPPTTTSPLPASPLTVSLDNVSTSTVDLKRAKLEVTVAANAPPGRHEVLVRQTTAGDVVYPVVVLPTDTTPRMGEVASISAGESHSLARTNSGEVWAWGRNDLGQLGDGTVIDRLVPVQVVGLPQPAIAVAAGGTHSLALLQDNSVWGWGRARVLRVTGNVVAQPTPVEVVAATEMTTAIAAGYGHSLIRTQDRRVIAWGQNSEGQTTARDFTNTGNETVVGLPQEATQIAASNNVSYAVTSDGMLWAWGDGSQGLLGPLASGPQEFAAPVQTVSNLELVAAGLRHTLVLSGGTVRAFGENERFSQLGDGSRTNQFGQGLIVPRVLSAQQIAAGAFHSLALQSNQSVRQWGRTTNGQAGVAVAPPNESRDYQLLPELVTGLPGATAIDAGDDYSVALTTASRTVYAWGNSRLGQLGDSTVATNRTTVAPVYGSGGSNAEHHLLTLLARGRGMISATGSGLPIATQVDARRGLAYAIPPGEIVMLTAEPATDNVFIGWGGQASGSNPVIQVTMDQSRACLARFGRPPRADFNYIGRSLTAGYTFSARGQDDADFDGLVVQWDWDVDNDGTFDASGQNIDVLQATNAIELRLRVTDNDGLTAESVQTLPGSDPSGNPGSGSGLIADFYTLPEAPLSLFPTTLAAYTSTSPGPLTNWQWDFTNDGTFDATGEEVTFTFPSAGTYSVRLVITGPNGGTASVTKPVAVIEG